MSRKSTQRGGICSIVILVVGLFIFIACNHKKQAEALSHESSTTTQISDYTAITQNFPNPSEWTETTPIKIYDALMFTWHEAEYGHVTLGDEFIVEDYLFFNSERGIIIRPAIDITKLEGANTGFNPEVDISPKADDVVYLFRSPEDKQPNGHYRLADVNVDSDVVYYGRVWHWSKAANGENYQLSKTDQVFAEVLATHQEVHEGDIYDVTVQFHSCGKQGTITGSAEHPFYVLDTNDYVNMADLQAGMSLKTDDGTTATVVNLTHLPEETKTLYNLTVAHANNFYVQPDNGSAALLVHNTPCSNLPDIADIINRYPIGNHCDRCAREIYDRFRDSGINAEIVTMRPNPSQRFRYISTKDGTTIASNSDDLYHQFVRSGDMVFDSLTGPQGMHWDDYQNLFYDGILDPSNGFFTFEKIAP